MPYCCNRNKQKCYYVNRTGRTEIIDSNGSRTGMYTETYTDPVEFWACVTEKSGFVSTREYWISPDNGYRIICDKHLPVDIDSLFYIGIEPGEGVKPNYVVEAIKPSLLSMTIDIKAVART